MHLWGWAFALAIAICGISAGVAYVNGEEHKAIGRAAQAGCNVDVTSTKTSIRCPKEIN